MYKWVFSFSFSRGCNIFCFKNPHWLKSHGVTSGDRGFTIYEKLCDHHRSCSSLAMLNLLYVLYVAFAHFHMMICSDGKGLSVTFLENVTKFDECFPHYHYLTPNVSQNVCYSSCFLGHWYFSSWVSVNLSGTGELGNASRNSLLQVRLEQGAG